MREGNKFSRALGSAAVALLVTFIGGQYPAQTTVRPAISISDGLAGINAQQVQGTRETARLVREIRKELLTLPWYGVFDWLEGTVGPDGTVTLTGWVVRPTTKSSAEARVKDIEGVTQLRSDIKVLPLSPNDDRIRRAVYFALFNNNSPLFRYALGANPSIHIIVENGRVILKGVVSSESDRNLAGIRANGVSGVFEVRNELVVEAEEEQ